MWESGADLGTFLIKYRHTIKPIGLGTFILSVLLDNTSLCVSSIGLIKSYWKEDNHFGETNHNNWKQPERFSAKRKTESNPWLISMARGIVNFGTWLFREMSQIFPSQLYTTWLGMSPNRYRLPACCWLGKWMGLDKVAWLFHVESTKSHGITDHVRSANNDDISLFLSLVQGKVIFQQVFVCLQGEGGHLQPCG